MWLLDSLMMTTSFVSFHPSSAHLGLKEKTAKHGQLPRLILMGH